MAILELEQAIRPMNKNEKVRLLHFLIDELAGEENELTNEDRYDIQRFDERLNEPDRPLSDYLAERARRVGRGYQLRERVRQVLHLL